MILASVKVSNEETNLTKKFPLYNENIILNKEDPLLQEIVKDVVDAFKGNVDEVALTLKMIWQ